MAITAESKPFTGNGDVSICVKISRVGRKTSNKQTILLPFHHSPVQNLGVVLQIICLL